MNPESKTFPRAAFSTLCAVVLAASVALLLLGATPSYAEEATPSASNAEPSVIDNTEGTFKVEIGGLGDTVTQNVEAGGKAVKPDDLPETTTDALGLGGNGWSGKRALFYGWVKSDGARKALTAEDHLSSVELFDFDTPITEDVKLTAYYYVPSYIVVLSVAAPDGSVRSVSSHVLEGDTILDTNPSTGGNDYRAMYEDPAGSFPGMGYEADVWYYIKTFTPFDPDKPITQNTSIANYLKGGSTVPDGDGGGITVAGSTGVTAQGVISGPNVPDGATVELGAEAVASGSAYDELTAYVSGVLAGVFEVNLTVDGKPVHDGFGTIEVTFPVDEKYNGHWVTVWHRHADGAITRDRVVAKDGKVTVAIFDLSTFALEVGELVAAETPEEDGDDGTDSDTSGTGSDAAGTGSDTPVTTTLAKTGDSPLGFASAGLAIVAFAVVAIAGYRSRRSAR